MVNKSKQFYKELDLQKGGKGMDAARDLLLLFVFFPPL